MFDPKCYELAEYFLPADASEELKSKFAQDVQDYIELMYPEPDRALGDLPESVAHATLG